MTLTIPVPSCIVKPVLPGFATRLAGVQATVDVAGCSMEDANSLFPGVAITVALWAVETVAAVGALNGAPVAPAVILAAAGTARRLLLPDGVAKETTWGLNVVALIKEFDVFTDIAVPVAATATGFNKVNPVVAAVVVMVSFT